MLPHEALRQYFGYPAFRPGQEDALTQVLAGRDTLVVMPTGSGKSLIYQLAALLMPGVTVVFSPLVSLMKDQVDSMTRRNLPATFVNSSLEPAEQLRRLRAFAAGEHKIMLVAPERLRSPAFNEALRGLELSLMVVDEAHCVSQWGHDFRPDYLRIAEARAAWQPHVTLALTATATPRTQGDIARLLNLSNAAHLIHGFNRPNLTLEVAHMPDQAVRLRWLKEFLASPDGVAAGGGIIYTTTRRDAEDVAAFVRERCNVPAQHYHAALESTERARVQDLFMSGDLPLVVATNAFGMGIDRPDVRYVLHYGTPGSLEAYYQEAGRGGRDGLPARAVLLHSSRDARLHEFFIDSESPSYDDLRTVSALLDRAGELEPEFIAQATGMKDLKARVTAELIALARRKSNGGPVDLRELADQVEQRREHKHDLLRHMIEYAQTESCRRRFILDYFGDEGDADAPVCCDNCVSQPGAAPDGPARPAATQAERAALIVLDTIALLKSRGQELGKGKLAQVLKGSLAEDVARYAANNRNHAKFASLTMKEIESLIGQLMTARYIRSAGADYPTLQLTERGAWALKERAAIDVTLRPVSAKAVTEREHLRTAGNTVQVTRELLGQGLKPAQIAAQRGLAPSTIYTHCAQLIAEASISVNAVVPPDVQAQVRAAIEAAGSAAYLSPIKARLPESIDYGVIRCVAEDWKRLHPEAQVAGAVAAPPAAAQAASQPVPPVATGRPGSGSMSSPMAETILACVESLPGKLHCSAVAQLLVGSEADRMDAYRDHPLYNRLSGHSRNVVLAIVDSLIEQGTLVVDEHGHVSLARARVASAPAPASAPVDAPANRTVPAPVNTAPNDDGGEQRDELFQRLRAWRTEQARAQAVPPYVIFHDRTLLAIAEARPADIGELRMVPGVGPVKCERYGEQVLEIVRKSQ
jgi:ATP-dependent DNA helicase RecQ